MRPGRALLIPLGLIACSTIASPGLADNDPIKLKISYCSSVTYSPDGKLIATAGESTQLWDAQTAKEVANFKVPSYSVALSADGKLLISGGPDADPVVRVWNIAERKEGHAMKGHAKALYGVAISRDGKYIASGGCADRTLRLWDAAEGKLLHTITVESFASHVAFSPDGKRLAACAGDVAKLWDCASGKEVLVLKGHDKMIKDITFSSDGKRIATGSFDRSAKIWDASSGKEVLTLKTRHPVFCLSFGPEGKVLATGGQGDVRVWDVESGKEQNSFKASDHSLMSVAISPDGRKVAIAGLDPVVIWKFAE